MRMDIIDKTFRCKAGFMVHNAVKVVTGGDEVSSIVAAESSGRAKWGGKNCAREENHNPGRRLDS